jgi:hypothetical protein
VDLRILKDVNDLWAKIYPYLRGQVMELFGKTHGDVLDPGPFAGGMSVELAGRHPACKITIAAQDSGIVTPCTSRLKMQGSTEE